MQVAFYDDAGIERSAHPPAQFGKALRRNDKMMGSYRNLRFYSQNNLSGIGK